MSRISRIRQILETHFDINELRIQDVSDQHKGHREAQDEDETHLKLQIVSKDFNQTTRIQRHRQIMTLLKDEFQNGLHALEIKALDVTPISK